MNVLQKSSIAACQPATNLPYYETLYHPPRPRAGIQQCHSISRTHCRQSQEEDWQKGNTSWKKSKKKLPPGLQKKVDRGGALPPGWKKKLEVGSVLEPEVDEVAKTVPEEILARLPDIPEGTEILEVGGEIIRVIESTREIVDILSGIGATD